MDAFTIEAFTLLGVGLFVISLRTTARITSVGFSGLKADDYLMVIAAGVYSAETFLAYSVGAYWHGLANNGMTDEYRRLLDPASDEYRLRVNGSKTQVAGWSTYTFLLWLVKASMCTFYLRLTDGLNFRTRIYVGFVLIAATWVAVLFSILFSCVPMARNWQIYPDPGNFCQPAISRIDILVTVVLNVLTDIYLMTIPIPMLWRSRLPPAKKAGLIVLFSGGIFVTMAGILRCVLIITDPVHGAQQAGSWACRETFVAVVTSNLPMIFPLARRYFGPLFSTIRSLTTSRRYGLSGASRSAGGERGTPGQHQLYKLEDKNPRRGQGPRTANPITNFTFSESEEHIVDNNGGGSTSGGDGEETGRTTVTMAPAATPGEGNGGILKEVMVRVTEERKSRAGMLDDDEAFGSPADYYLAQQVRKSEDAPQRGGRGPKRASLGFVR